MKKLLSRSVFCPALTLMSAALALPGHADSFTVDGVDQPWAPVSDKVTVEDVADADTLITVDEKIAPTVTLHTGCATGGEVSGNVVTVSDSELKAVQGARIEGDGTATENTVELTNTTATGSVYGAFVTQNGEASGNFVSVTGGEVGFLSGGCVTQDGKVNENSVSVTDATVTGYMIGGYMYADGGKSSSLTNEASGNSVTLSNSQTTSYVYGAYVLGNGTANDNSVTLSNSQTTNKATYGAYIQENGTANNNSVTLDGSTAERAVYGACMKGTAAGLDTNELTNNSVTIKNGSTLNRGAMAAYTNYGTVTDNTLTIEDSTVIYNGYDTIGALVMNEGSASNNTLIVKNSTLEVHSLIAASVEKGDATNNTLIIENSTITRSYASTSQVCAGIANEKAINNTVILRGDCTIEANILVGDANANTYETEGLGNTLRLEGFTGSVNAIYNFENINITLKDWDPSQYVLETVEPLDLAGKNVTLEAIESVAEGATMPKVGEELKLFSNTTNEATANLNILPEYRNIKYGRTRLIDLQFDVDETTGEVTFDSEGGLAGQVVNVHLNPQFKALAEGRVAALTFTNRAGNLAAEQGMEQAGRAAAVEGTRMATFMAMSAGHDKVDSGSHVDADGVATMLGVSAGMLREKALTLGGFIEGGWGQYTTHNSFADMPAIRGKGESSYVGGGVLARYAFRKGKMKGLALEASFRAGKQDTDFSGSDRNGEFAGYELSNSYLAGHLGVSYTFSTCERFVNTLYARYFRSHLGSDSASLWEGDSVHFDATHSNRVRFGARTSWKASAKWTPYAGLAYEWECSGAARSTVDNERVAAPSMRGGSVMAELGTTWQPLEEKPLWFHGGIQGSAGKTQGYGANIGCTVAF